MESGAASAPGRRSFWGWGVDGAGLAATERDDLARLVVSGLGIDGVEVTPPPTLDELDLPAPRVRPPASLAPLCTDDPYERAAHTYGKSFRDVVRALARDFRRPPDLVALPRTEGDVSALLDWCASTGVAAIPYGGGSSVVGGVEAGGAGDHPGVVTLDLRRLDRVVEVDGASRAARIQAGVYGPALEDRLRPHGLTLRHFPQSFEFSTLGGWLATRSAGHYATLHTHIDDFVESMTAVTPRGTIETRRLPGSGAGPSPDRLLLGSEGVLGVITEAWMRLQDRPRHRASAVARFRTFEAGATAARAVVQSGLHPSNCRLIDATEALVTGVADGSAHLLLLAFESADHPLDAWIGRAVECARDHGASIDTTDVRTSSEPAIPPGAAGGGSGDGRGDPAGTWRRSFLRAPYVRDALVAMGLVNETFETAVTWDRFPSLHTTVVGTVTAAMKACGAWPGFVTCRFTHVYPDGPAPYYTVVGRGAPDPAERLAQWATIKTAASDALLGGGATITHHHAVGRDHRPWYDRQRPDLFAEALRAAKAALDPAGILNPGVLVDP